MPLGAAGARSRCSRNQPSRAGTGTSPANATISPSRSATKQRRYSTKRNGSTCTRNPIGAIFRPANQRSASRDTASRVGPDASSAAVTSRVVTPLAPRAPQLLAQTAMGAQDDRPVVGIPHGLLPEPQRRQARLGEGHEALLGREETTALAGGARQRHELEGDARDPFKGCDRRAGHHPRAARIHVRHAGVVAEKGVSIAIVECLERRGV